MPSSLSSIGQTQLGTVRYAHLRDSNGQYTKGLFCKEFCNRCNAAWKTGQYIVVGDSFPVPQCQVNEALANFHALTECDPASEKAQRLLIPEPDGKYHLYDPNGNCENCYDSIADFMGEIRGTAS